MTIVCPTCDMDAEALSYGTFECDDEKSERLVLEVAVACPHCDSFFMFEHRIKPANVDKWVKKYGFQ